MASRSHPHRRHRRVPTEVPLESKVDRLKGRSHSTDVSAGGMALLLPRDAKVGDHLQFELELAGGETCILEGEICRVEDIGREDVHKVGLRWVNLNRDRADALDRYCRGLRAAVDRGGESNPDPGSSG